MPKENKRQRFLKVLYSCSSPWHPERQDYDHRLGTFRRHFENREKFAAAGFFSSGREITCFYCDAKLPDRHSPDPWKQHAAIEPQCEFVLRCRGHEWVANINGNTNQDADAFVEENESCCRSVNSGTARNGTSSQSGNSGTARNGTSSQSGNSGTAGKGTSSQSGNSGTARNGTSSQSGNSGTAGNGTSSQSGNNGTARNGTSSQTGNIGTARNGTSSQSGNSGTLQNNGVSLDRDQNSGTLQNREASQNIGTPQNRETSQNIETPQDRELSQSNGTTQNNEVLPSAGVTNGTLTANETSAGDEGTDTPESQRLSLNEDGEIDMKHEHALRRRKK